jgi:hypothetical protein
MPLGSALESVSGMLGIPVLLEKRIVRGVDGDEKCGAVERVDASVVGVKVPVRMAPFACAGGRKIS